MNFGLDEEFRSYLKMTGKQKKNLCRGEIYIDVVKEIVDQKISC